MPSRKRVSVALGAVLVAGPAFAGDDIHGATALATGGAVMANPRTNDAISSNPGVLGIASRYDISGHAGTRPGGWETHLGVVDSRSSPVSLGAAYRRLVEEPEFSSEDLPGWVVVGETPTNVKRYHDIQLALAAPALNRKLSLGLGGNLSFTQHDRGGGGREGDLDVGAAYQPLPWLTIGASGQNLLPVEWGHPLDVGLGVHLADEGIGELAVEVEQRFEAEPGTAVRAGFMKPLGELELRSGWRRESDAAMGVGWGLSWGNEQGAVDYAMEIPLGGKLTFGAIVHRVGIRIWA
jgi:hypothetical protein